ncbi:MAG: hypothetical protein AAB773_01615 [Patescibacteria group bacterium]
MLYFIHGNDREQARAKLNTLLNSLFTKKPNASFFKLDDRSCTEADILEMIGGRGLFENKYVVLLENTLQNENTKDIVLTRLKEIAGSQNIFIVFEGETDKQTCAKIEKKAEKVLEFTLPKTTQKKEKFDIFALTDAFAARDKKRAWVLLQKAFLAGLSPEEIHSMLFWQTKTMLLAKHETLPQNAGLNPFVFRKSKASAQKFTDDELRSLSAGLVLLYHNARRGIIPFEIGLEQFLLARV